MFGQGDCVVAAKSFCGPRRLTFIKQKHAPIKNPKTRRRAHHIS
jgi:hypothetical protein